ncbi:MAG: type II secretion system F family protein [Pseudomonadota bacterium]|nr:type II secretion system F family protein [Pseudomonadota bacterium]
MEYLLQFLSDLVGDPQRLSLVFTLAVALGMFVFALGLMFLLGSASDPLRRRLALLGGSPKPSSSVRLAKALEPLSPYILPQKDWERSKVSTRLVHAGYRTGSALTVFYALKIFGGLALLVLVLAAATWYPGLSTNQVVFFAILAAFVGGLVPNYVLDHQVKKRQKMLRNAFPDALDLLVVCSEAGLGLNMAIQRVSRELNASHPALGDELSLVNVEIRAGVDRVEALRNLAQRTGLEDIRGLVSLLAQSLRFGTSIADTLRVYAEEFRDRRMQRAEEQAAKMGIKMIFPLVACIFPSFFLIAAGPAVLMLMEVFGGR